MGDPPAAPGRPPDPSAEPAIPPGVHRWNWGAFAFTWIWGLANHVYISLLALIPVVGIVMAFVLGANGGRWAWESKPWRDAAHFARTQHRWAVAAAWVWGGIALLVAISIPIAISSSPSESEAESTLTERITTNDGRFSISIPSTWAEAELDADAVLQAEHVLKDVYVIVVTDPKLDFAEDIDLKAFAEGSSDIGDVIAGPSQVSVAGRTAYQTEVEAVVEDVRIIYVITALEAGDDFVRVIAWTVPSEIDSFRPLLKRITGSLTVSP